MAIFGIGAYYDHASDVSDKFIARGGAFVGWGEDQAPSLHSILHSLKPGDIVYIKSFPPGKKRLEIKAVGIVLDDKVIEDKRLGTGRRTAWIELKHSIVLEKFSDKNNVYNNTIYEEFNAKVQKVVLQVLLPSKSKPRKVRSASRS